MSSPHSDTGANMADATPCAAFYLADERSLLGRQDNGRLQMLVRHDTLEVSAGEFQEYSPAGEKIDL